MAPSDTVNRAARNGSIPWTSPFAVVSVIALLVVAKLAVGAATDLVGDEAYYTLWSLYPLQAGYYDHPPAVVWFIEAGQFLLGETALASRLAAIAATIVCALAVWRTAIALFADSTIAALGALWFSLSLGVAVGLLIVTPDAPSLLFWTLAIWAAAELYRSRNANWWLVFGLFAGLGLQAKYTGLFLGAGIVVWLLAYAGNRRWFRCWQLYAGGILALAVFWPVVRWNIGHDFASLKFQLGRSTEAAPSLSRVAQYLPEFIAAQAGMLWPGLFLFAVAGFTLVLRRREFRRDPALGLLVTTAAPALVYFAWHAFHSRVQGNWTLPLFGQLALLGAWAAVTWLPSSDRARAVWLWLRRWQAPLALLLVAVLYAFVAFAPLRIPARLPTDEMAGWSELADETAAIAHKVGARAVYTPDYTLVGAMASYLRFGGDDLAVYPSAGLQHYTFMDVPEPGEIGGPVLYAVRARPDADIAPALRLFGVDAPHLSSAVRNGPGGRPAERVDFYLVSGR
jgi:4-amino-4-deoxy-L-arabinose transferase-like glycosyltransferase